MFKNLLKHKSLAIMIIVFIPLFLLTSCSSGKAKTIEYHDDLQSVVDEMIDSSATAEEILNVYTVLWKTNIERDITIGDLMDLFEAHSYEIKDNFTLSKEDERYVEFSVISHRGDFNNIINQLNNYYKGEIGELESSLINVSNKLKELNDPPDEYEKVYEEIVELYKLYNEYAQMVINPSGSLATFNDSRTQLSSGIVNKVEEIEIIMPNKEE